MIYGCAFPPLTPVPNVSPSPLYCLSAGSLICDSFSWFLSSRALSCKYFCCKHPSPSLVRELTLPLEATKDTCILFGILQLIRFKAITFITIAALHSESKSFIFRVTDSCCVGTLEDPEKKTIDYNTAATRYMLSVSVVCCSRSLFTQYIVQRGQMVHSMLAIHHLACT